MNNRITISQGFAHENIFLTTLIVMINHILKQNIDLHNHISLYKNVIHLYRSAFISLLR